MMDLKTAATYWRESGGEYDQKSERAIISIPALQKFVVSVIGWTLINNKDGEAFIALKDKLRAAEQERDQYKAELISSRNYWSELYSKTNNELESLRAKIKEAHVDALKTVINAMQLISKKYPDIDHLHISIFEDESYGFKGKGINFEKHEEIFEADDIGIEGIINFCNRFIEENKNLIPD